MDLDKEKELIKKAQKDPEAFTQLYDEYYSQIFGYVLKRVADLMIAQDITSETFFKTLKKLWQFRWKNIPFSAWLYRITNNEIKRLPICRQRRGCYIPSFIGYPN